MKEKIFRFNKAKKRLARETQTHEEQQRNMQAHKSPNNSNKVKVTDILYEVQTRRSVFSNFSTHVEFVDAKNNKCTRELIESRVENTDWKWLTTDWQHGGADSWQYASKWSVKESHWSYAEGLFDVVRRRKWTRSRVNTVTDAVYNNLLAERESGLFTVELISNNKASESIQAEVDTLTQQLQKQYVEISAKTHKPNILLLGGSGAGKSSLVNAVFGKPLAEIGEGKPITQQYTKFSGADSPVVIYDSKGIEHGYVETGFIADTKKFFKKLRSEPELEKHIHVVWYVLDLTQARFQPFEAQFCREQLRDIPIIFVLNKADAVSTEVRDIMIKVISDHNLSNCIGIYATVANCKNFDSKTCPNCQSPKIRKRLKAGTCTIMCKECKYNVTMEKTSGIDQLSRATLSVMPDLVKEVYIVSQKSHVFGQEAKAKEIIASVAQEASMTKYERLSEQLIDMTKKLVKLYQMQTISPVMEKAVKERYEIFFSEQKLSKRALIFLNDLFSKKYTIAQAFVVAAGLEVCHAVINFKSAAIQQAVRSFEDQVNNEEEQVIDQDETVQADEEKKPVSPTSPASQNTIAVAQKSVKAIHGEEENIEWFLQKLVANLHLELDSTMVFTISEEIRKFQSVQKYLGFIAVDGKRIYITPDWDEIRRRKREQEEQDKKDLAIPLYTYQQVPQQQSDPSSSQSSSTQQQH